MTIGNDHTFNPNGVEAFNSFILKFNPDLREYVGLTDRFDDVRTRLAEAFGLNITDSEEISEILYFNDNGTDGFLVSFNRGNSDRIACLTQGFISEIEEKNVGAELEDGYKHVTSDGKWVLKIKSNDMDNPFSIKVYRDNPYSDFFYELIPVEGDGPVVFMVYPTKMSVTEFCKHQSNFTSQDVIDHISKASNIIERLEFFIRYKSTYDGNQDVNVTL